MMKTFCREAKATVPLWCMHRVLRTRLAEARATAQLWCEVPGVEDPVCTSSGGTHRVSTTRCAKRPRPPSSVVRCTGC